MNITFMIGNGFDLGLGLKTKYSHFYEVYLKDRYNDENLLKFKEDISSKIDNWSDFEKEFGKYSLECDTSDIYLSRFEDFVEKFNQYLVAEELRAKYWEESKIVDSMTSAFENFYKNGKIVDEELFGKIVNKSTGKNTFNFITYNYTRCLDKCLEVLKTNKKEDSTFLIGDVVHVHGFLDENMIMGVNDSTQIANKNYCSLRRVQNEIVKPVANNTLKMNYDLYATQLIEKSDIICIYGMSLGETDKKWWNLISSWLYNGSSRRLIIFVDNEKYNKALPYTWTRTMEDAEERFLSFSSLSNEQKVKIINRMYYQVNNHIFEMGFITDNFYEKILFGELENNTVVM